MSRNLRPPAATRAVFSTVLALTCAFSPVCAPSALAATSAGSAASSTSASAAASSSSAAVSSSAEAIDNPVEAPSTNTPVAFLYDVDNDAVLLDKESTTRSYPASTTKVMTALLVLERANLDDVVTVSADDFGMLGEESMMSGIKDGEQLTVKNLLACMLLPSGNDAAYVLARYVGGTWQDFVALMNEKAVELGCSDTHFANPCGLHDDNHYTCARDLALIFRAALEYPVFTEIAGSATWSLPATNQNSARALTTTDFLIQPSSDAYADGVVTAGKTGYTSEGGKCLVVAAEKDGRHLVAVTLGGNNDASYGEPTSNFYGMRDLLNWGFDAWGDVDVVSSGDELGSVAVRLSEDGDTLGVVSATTLTAFAPTGLTLSDLDVRLSVPASVEAPVSAGDVLGDATVSYDGRELGVVQVKAAKSMSWSLRLFVEDWLSEPIHLLIAVGAVVLLVVVLGLIANARRRAKEEQPQRANIPGGGAASGRGAVKLERGADRRGANNGARGAGRGAHFKK